jgi:uncharacterized protein YdhG (YjbR/CyaY superfamily)
VRKPTSVQQYLSWQNDEQRAALDTLREVISSAVPDATEGISYSMPAFLLDGKGLVCYAAFNDHYSLFPMSTAAMTKHAEQLGDRVTGKGTIRFEYDERLPAGLVKKIVKTRVAELRARTNRR